MALLISGVPRSGTSMLRRICDGHPDIGVASESRIFSFPPRGFLVHAKNVAGNVTHRNWNALRAGEIKYIARTYSFMVRYLTTLAAKRNFGEIDFVSKVEALHAMFPDANIVGDKYPGYVFELEKFVNQKGLNCLVIYRDGRDVVSSTLRRSMKWKGTFVLKNMGSVEKIIDRWTFGIEKMQENVDRIFTVRYEDLVTNPREVMKGIGGWLGVDADKFPVQFIRNQSIGKHRDYLTESQLRIIYERTSETLIRLNYE